MGWAKFFATLEQYREVCAYVDKECQILRKPTMLHPVEGVFEGVFG